MVRKIKVVNVVETEIKQDPIVEIPNEPTPAEIASNTSVEVNVDPESPKPEEVIQSEDEIKVITNKEELIQNKAPTGTCELCGKTMLLKNLKYAHPKVCKSKPPPPPAQYHGLVHGDLCLPPHLHRYHDGTSSKYFHLVKIKYQY